MKIFLTIFSIAVLKCLITAGRDVSVSDWTKVNGGLSRVAIGGKGTWGVNSNHHIYYRNGNNWVRFNGGLVDISVGGNEVWGVNRQDEIYRKVGSGNWQRINGGLIQISVSQSDHVWGVNRGHNIYRRAGNSWTQIGGGLKCISVGPSGVWGVNRNGQIYYRTGTYGDVNTGGSGWKQIQGGLKWISSGKDIVFGVNSGGNIYYRSGITSASPTGKKWIQISGGLKQVDVYNNIVWGVNSNDEIYTLTIKPYLSPCKCQDTINTSDWEVIDVVYDIDSGNARLLPPDVVTTQVVNNEISSISQSSGFTASRTVSETSSFSHTAGASVTVGTTFSAGIPLVADGEVSVEVSASYEYSSGKETSTEKTLEAQFNCIAPPRRTMTCKAIVQQYQTNVPYTQSWKHKTLGCTCRTSGMFTGIGATRMMLEMNEENTKN